MSKQVSLRCSEELAWKIGASDLPAKMLDDGQLYKLISLGAYAIVHTARGSLLWRIDPDAWRMA